jgi:hypothetical protein
LALRLEFQCVNDRGITTVSKPLAGTWLDRLRRQTGAQIALICTVATGVLWLALILIAPDANPWVNYLLGAVLFIPSLVALVMQLMPTVTQDFKYVPPGFAAIVTGKKGQTKMYASSDVQQRINFSVVNGEVVEPFDCRERASTLPHVCLSADGATVALTVHVLWSISAIAKYQSKAQSPADVVNTATLAALTRKIGVMEHSKITADAYASIEADVLALVKGRLADYGIAAHAVDLTHIQSWPKPPKPDEKDKKSE